MNDQHDAHVFFVVVPSSIFFCVSSQVSLCVSLLWGLTFHPSMRTKSPLPSPHPKIEDNFRVFPEAAMAFCAFSFFLPSGIFFPSKELRAEEREALMDFCLPLAGALCIWLSFLFHTECKHP